MSVEPLENGHYFTDNPLRPLELERGERLLYRLTEFGRILWEVGIDVGPRKMLDLAETLKYVDITNKEDFYNRSNALCWQSTSKKRSLTRCFSIIGICGTVKIIRVRIQGERQNATSGRCAFHPLSAKDWPST